MTDINYDSVFAVVRRELETHYPRRQINKWTTCFGPFMVFNSRPSEQEKWINMYCPGPPNPPYKMKKYHVKLEFLNNATVIFDNFVSMGDIYFEEYTSNYTSLDMFKIRFKQWANRVDHENPLISNDLVQDSPWAPDMTACLSAIHQRIVRLEHRC